MATLEEQYSTGKKIQKPSDDPIVAVRALKLRSTLSQLNQYVEKNIPDAQAWVDVTESALNNVNTILKQMNTYCVQGANDTLTPTNRESILKNLIELKEQVYQEGNAEYAGRYVFPGYKTDTPLIFNEDEKDKHYEIVQEFTPDKVGVYKSISGELDASSTVLDDPSITVDDFLEAPKYQQSYRLQLGYSDLKDLKSLKIGDTTVDLPALAASDKYKVKTSSDADRYEPADDQIFYLQDTGEIIFGKDYFEQIKQKDGISVTYEKDSFKKDELRPEHYFNCTVTDKTNPTADPIKYKKQDQSIEYEVNFNQTIRINTEASTCITQEIDRLVDDIESAIYEVSNIESKIAVVNEKLKETGLSTDQIDALKKLNEQLDTELTLANSILQEKFSAGITATQQFQNNLNESIADLGARSKRLELTLSRLESQKTELEDLKSTNEDVDMVGTIIQYKSAESIYTASLSAAGGVVKTSLLDFL